MKIQIDTTKSLKIQVLAINPSRQFTMVDSYPAMDIDSRFDFDTFNRLLYLATSNKTRQQIEHELCLLQIPDVNSVVDCDNYLLLPCFPNTYH